MADDAFDLVVIGSGPGGYVAAIRAGQLGLRTACVEKYPTLGGTCVNVGCIPSKALLDSSEHYERAQHGLAAHGVNVSGVALDLKTMHARKTKVVAELTRGIDGLLKKNKVERIVGTGRLVAANEVEVAGEGDARRLKTKRVLIATGSKPVALPGIAIDDRRVIHSTHALALEEVPGRLLVIGAGVIGLELGSVWRRLGSEVTVLESMDRALPGVDAGSAKLLQRSLERQGFKFRFGVSARAATVSGDEVRVEVAGSGGAPETLVADILLVAVGRRPFTDGLGAAELGVKLDAKGRVVVSEHFETHVPGVFAIGDVIAGPMLAHKAEEEGIACVERMAGVAGHVNYACIPNVVYTHPELASVGLSEEDARERGLEVRVGTFPFQANGRAKAMGDREGQVKLVADAATDRLLGAHIVGARASDMIAELVVAMELGASAEDVARSVHAHPTLPEAVKEAALGVAGRAIHI
jgi:dihydrolipoamide dehydrogenase